MTLGDPIMGGLHLIFTLSLVLAGVCIWKLIKLAFIGLVHAVCNVIHKHEP